MSHFVKIQSKIKDINKLKATLRVSNIPFECEQGKKITCQGYGGVTTQADVVVKKANLPSASYGDLGFNEVTGGVEITADSSLQNHKWMDKLHQTYSEVVVDDFALMNGWNVEKTVEQNGNVVMLMSQ